MNRIKTNQDPFMQRLTRNIPKKGQINNTPIRQRQYQNKQNIQNQQNKHKDHHQDIYQRQSMGSYINQSFTADNSRTIPKRRISMPVNRGCVNHNDIDAQFKISIDGQSLNYCSKCATHLASNGFKVQKILSSRSPRRIKQSRPSPFVKRKQELHQFLQGLSQLQKGYEQTSDKIYKIQNSHQSQKQTITNFYSSLFQYLEYIKNEHLHFLQEESIRNTQICQIQSAQITQTVQELHDMKEDIEENVQKIIQEVDQTNYNECMNYYKQKKGVHQHRLQQLGIDAHVANYTTSECVEQKLSQFKYFIDELTGILTSKAESMDY